MNNEINEAIEQGREEARNICDIQGGTSPECAAAWDAVEELQAAAAHKKQKPQKSSFEVYCDNNPEAAECRLYDD
ncbi:Calvin cycle protein CP12 [Limnospira fusiformis]|uniref:Calvin cycle protein CP12 n=1 Tax=Limnospira fusiformis TaxID=54297 RepID=UPI001448ED2D|nr:hypothetical protein HFV01_24960 [Limnospira fusiformis SAG 85.79]